MSLDLQIWLNGITYVVMIVQFLRVSSELSTKSAGQKNNV